MVIIRSQLTANPFVWGTYLHFMATITHIMYQRMNHFQVLSLNTLKKYTLYSEGFTLRPSWFYIKICQLLINLDWKT